VGKEKVFPQFKRMTSSTPVEPFGKVSHNSRASSWRSNIPELTLLQKSDPYAELKAAYAAGGEIEVKFPSDKEWKPWRSNLAPSWTSPPECYRIKPKAVEPELKAGQMAIVKTEGRESCHCLVAGDVVTIVDLEGPKNLFQVKRWRDNRLQYLNREDFEILPVSFDSHY
jgi:hypothetical protein